MFFGDIIHTLVFCLVLLKDYKKIRQITFTYISYDFMRERKHYN